MIKRTAVFGYTQEEIESLYKLPGDTTPMSVADLEALRNLARERSHICPTREALLAAGVQRLAREIKSIKDITQ